jgi:hypothetical protein
MRFVVVFHGNGTGFSMAMGQGLTWQWDRVFHGNGTAFSMAMGQGLTWQWDRVFHGNGTGFSMAMGQGFPWQWDRVFHGNGTGFSQCFSLLVSVHEWATFIFIYTLLLSGQTGEAWEPPKKSSALSGIGEH